jgi:hypothetical protein
MKIEHTTYNKNHTAQPTRRHPENSSGDKERPVTMWPRTEASPPEQETYLMLERRLEKEAQRERSTPESRGREAQRPRSKPVAATVGTQTRRSHPLRRKPNFSESLRECLGSPKPAAKKHVEEKQQTTKIYTLRDAIRAGIMEQAVPPLTVPTTNGRSAPPQPQAPLVKQDQLTKLHTLRDAIRAGKLEQAIPPDGFAKTNGGPAPPRSQARVARPEPPSTSRQRKITSAPTKLGEFIDRGADILEETRKEISSKFKPPFEHLNYPSFTHSGRKSRRNSDASDMSFHCIGEQETESTEAFEALKTREQQNAQTQRTSYEGTNPWVHPPPAACRLCRKPGVRGIRGLCNKCESDFMGPETRRYEFIDSDDEEIKPTPPLKDLKIMNVKRAKDLGARRKSVSHSTPYNRGHKQQQSSEKAEFRITNTDSYPVINYPIRQHSRNAMIDRGDGDEPFRGWQTSAMRSEYERTESLYKAGQIAFETDGVEKSFGNDSTPPIDRDSNFYNFYDDLLEDNRSKAPF